MKKFMISSICILAICAMFLTNVDLNAKIYYCAPGGTIRGPGGATSRMGDLMAGSTITITDGYFAGAHLGCQTSTSTCWNILDGGGAIEIPLISGDANPDVIDVIVVTYQ